MKLKLIWMDTKDNTYELGILENKDDKYYFTIQYENLKQATRNGCLGIGALDLSETFFESDELFDFFKERIPEEDHPRLEVWMQKFNLGEYNEMELLKATGAMIATDRYYMCEV
ncbi:MAG: HipA N-terminal domain-containing protein [Oscillospiraceae bacterium]|nr:HipA N-terminal domain-containing protein [Oscillospiraceae bacterium]